MPCEVHHVFISCMDQIRVDKIIILKIIILKSCLWQKHGAENQLGRADTDDDL